METEYGDKKSYIPNDLCNIVNEWRSDIYETQEIAILGIEHENADSLKVPLGFHDRLEWLKFDLLAIPDQLIEAKDGYHYIHADIGDVDQAVETFKVCFTHVHEKKPLGNNYYREPNHIEKEENQGTNLVWVRLFITWYPKSSILTRDFVRD